MEVSGNIEFDPVKGMQAHGKDEALLRSFLDSTLERSVVTYTHQPLYIQGNNSH
jgi:hypothetical protein